MDTNLWRKILHITTSSKGVTKMQKDECVFGRKVRVQTGFDTAWEYRVTGWGRIEKEQLCIVAPEATTPGQTELSKSMRDRQLHRAAEMERERAIKEGKTSRFIENVTKESLQKCLVRESMGVGVRHFDIHGFSAAIRDGHEVYLEFPDEKLKRVIVIIDDEDFAKVMTDYFERLWEKSVPLQERAKELEKG